MIVSIIGLGLMGGSFAKALKKYNLATKILGYDHNKEHQKQALELGFVDEIIEFEDIKKSDLILLAIPVDAIVKVLPKLKDIKDSLIVDFGSTKELIVKNIPNSIKHLYIPAHPMTGTEKFGPYAAIDGLYENKVMILCDTDYVEKKYLDIFLKIINTFNMKIHYMSSDEHDKHACLISHLPHAISFALATLVMEEEDHKTIVALAGGGFKDMSRIAKSSPVMWSDIFRQNRNNLLSSIDKYQQQLTKIKEFIEQEDWDGLKKQIEFANTLHNIL